MLNKSPRNSIRSLSPSDVLFEKLRSVLLIPGPQQIARSEFPILPSCTPSGLAAESKTPLSKRFGSNAYPDTGWQAGIVAVGLASWANGPVPKAQTVPRGFAVLNRVTRFGSPGASKLNVLSNN